MVLGSCNLGLVHACHQVVAAAPRGWLVALHEYRYLAWPEYRYRLRPSKTISMTMNFAMNGLDYIISRRKYRLLQFTVTSHTVLQ